MQETTAQLGQALLEGIWQLFSIQVPGFTFSFGELWLGVFIGTLSILVVKLVFGFGGGETPRTNSTKNPRISDARRNDEF